MLRVVITDSGYKDYNIERNLIESIGGKLEIKNCVTVKDVIDLCRDADGVILRQQPFSREVIENLRKCRVVARYGVGVDNIDVSSATEKGIVVANVINYAIDEVAEQSIALLFSCVRKITSHDKQIRAGTWDIGQKDPIFRIQRKTFGLIGLGAIAQALARKLKGFELRFIAYDPFVSREISKKLSVELVDFEKVIKESDFISLHSSLTEKTKHMINADTLAMMKSTAILINTARGGLIDTIALYQALKEGTINSAGIDCHEQEPVSKNYCLFKLNNVVLSDHKGWYSEESIKTLKREAAEAVVAVFSGKRPKSVINPEVFESIKNMEK